MTGYHIVVVVLMLVSSVSSQAASQVNKTVCFDKTLQQLQETSNELESAFLQTQFIDLVIIFDISGSQSGSSLSDMKQFATDLITFLQVEYGRYLDPQYMRLEMIVFNVVANLTGKNINSCNFQDQLNAIQFPAIPSQTFVHTALLTALTYFQQATAKRGPDTKQILFVMTDGEFDDVPSDISLAIYRLRLQQVEVFSCGVGQWLDSAAKEAALKALTTNATNDYLCYYDWELVLSLQKRTHPVTDLWVAVTSDEDIRCTTPCANNAECSCDVVQTTYVCACTRNYYLNQNSVCAECPSGTMKDVIGNDISLCVSSPSSSSLALGLGVGLGLGLLILLIVILLLVYFCCCCCCIAASKTEDKEEHYSEIGNLASLKVQNNAKMNNYEAEVTRKKTILYMNTNELAAEGAKGGKNTGSPQEELDTKILQQFLAYDKDKQATVASYDLQLSVSTLTNILRVLRTGKIGVELEVARRTFLVDEALVNEKVTAVEIPPVTLQQARRREKGLRNSAAYLNGLWVIMGRKHIIIGIGSACDKEEGVSEAWRLAAILDNKSPDV